MIFDRAFQTVKQNIVGHNVSHSAAASRCDTEQSVAITNVWQAPIIILSNEHQQELEKHYLNYSSTIPNESFEAIFGDKSVDL